MADSYGLNIDRTGTRELDKNNHLELTEKCAIFRTLAVVNSLFGRQNIVSQYAKNKSTFHSRTGNAGDVGFFGRRTAMGGAAFVVQVRAKLGFNANGRNITEIKDGFVLRAGEASDLFGLGGKKEVLRPDNSFFWSDFIGNLIGLVRPQKSKEVALSVDSLFFFDWLDRRVRSLF